MKIKRNLTICTCVLCCWLAFMGGCFKGTSYTPVNRLPSGVTILNSCIDTSGMDPFYLIQGQFNTERDINQICHEFKLFPCVLPSDSIARLFNKKHQLPWFPMKNPSRSYCYCSVNPDGTLKADADFERVDIVLWVDEVNKEFILQDAGL